MLYHLDIAGPGPLPLLHLHGWCCDHQAMLPVAEALPHIPHRLVDLPGHGRSPAGSSLSIQDQATAALSVAPSAFVAIGHSMGGQIALQMATIAPDRVRAVILLDPAHIIPIPSALAYARSMRDQLQRRDPSEVVRAFARAQLVGPVDDARFDRLVETMAATSAETARKAWEAILAFDGASALARLSVPTLAIAIDKPVNRLADLARASPFITTGQVAASGHMLQFEAMDQVVAMIGRWALVRNVPLGLRGTSAST